MDKTIESILVGRSAPCACRRFRASTGCAGELLEQINLGLDESTHDGIILLAELVLLMYVLQVGYKRPLQKEDLWRYDEMRRTRYLADTLTVNIEKRQKSGKSKHILLSALNDTFFRQFWIAGLFKVIYYVFGVLME